MTQTDFQQAILETEAKAKKTVEQAQAEGQTEKIQYQKVLETKNEAAVEALREKEKQDILNGGEDAKKNYDHSVDLAQKEAQDLKISAEKESALILESLLSFLMVDCLKAGK